MSVKSFFQGFVTGAFIAGVAGVIGGLMISPKSGEELRKDLAAYLKDVQKELDRVLRQAKVVTKDTYEKAVDEVTATYSRLKEINADDMKEISDRLKKDWKTFSKRAQDIATREE